MNAKTRWTLLILMSLTALGLLGKSLSKEPQASKPALSLYQQALQYSGRPMEDRDLPTLLSEKDEPGGPAGRSKACETFEMQIETLPLESLLADLKDGKLQIPESCLADEATDHLFQSLKSACQPTELQNEANSCEQNLFSYRSRRIQLWASDKDVKSLSMEVLVQRFFGLLNAELPTGRLRPADLREIALELRNRIPESGTPSRIEAVSYFFEANPSLEDRQALRRALDEARRKNPDDWQIYEFQLMQEAQENLGRYAQMIQSLLKSQPDSKIGLYHSACLAWKTNQKEKAQALFRKVAEMDPGDERFRDTEAKARTSDISQPVCTATMRFSPDQF